MRELLCTVPVHACWNERNYNITVDACAWQVPSCDLHGSSDSNTLTSDGYQTLPEPELIAFICCAVGHFHFLAMNPFSLPAKFYSRNFYDYYIIFLNAKIHHRLCFCCMLFSSRAQHAPNAPVPPFRSAPNQSWRCANRQQICQTQILWNTKTFSVVVIGSFTTVWAHSAKVSIGNTFIYL